MVGTRLFGLALTLGASVVTGAVYYLIPYNLKFPAIIVAVPLVAAVAGIFQVITGLTLLQANAKLASFPWWKKCAVVTLALFLLAIGLLAFAMFVAQVEGV